LSDNQSKKTEPKSALKVAATIVLLCAISAGMLLGLIISTRNSPNDHLMQDAKWLLGAWIISAAFSIALRRFRYVTILIISQAMSMLLCIVNSDFADPDWHNLTGTACVGMITGMVTGVGYSLVRSSVG
jgi:hypothetical protein